MRYIVSNPESGTSRVTRQHIQDITHTTNTNRYSIITKSHSTEQTQTNTEREAHNRSSVTNLHQEDFEPFYVISLILDGSLMQGAQPPYLDYSGS